MNVLMVGGGGREHALAWKLAQSQDVSTVFVAPGNAGTAHEPGCQNVDLSPSDFTGLINFAKANDCLQCWRRGKVAPCPRQRPP